MIVEKDDEFKGLVKNLCASISHAELSVEALSSALSTLQKVCFTGEHYTITYPGLNSVGGGGGN